MTAACDQCRGPLFPCEPFSANDARAIHGIKGGVVGAAFSALNKAGVIRPVGDETSTDVGTHGHRIYRWIGSEAA